MIGCQVEHHVVPDLYAKRLEDPIPADGSLRGKHLIADRLYIHASRHDERPATAIEEPSKFVCHRVGQRLGCSGQDQDGQVGGIERIGLQRHPAHVESLAQGSLDSRVGGTLLLAQRWRLDVETHR